jgi:serine/threonine protein kinase
MKIADFGFATHGESHREFSSSLVRGTEIYLAPELITDHHYSKESDIWACGCIFYERGLATYGRRRAFDNGYAILQYATKKEIPPPQFSWSTFRSQPAAIPLDKRRYQPVAEQWWNWWNIVFAAVFHRERERRPTALQLSEGLHLMANGLEPILPDYRTRESN